MSENNINNKAVMNSSINDNNRDNGKHSNEESV